MAAFCVREDVWDPVWIARDHAIGRQDTVRLLHLVWLLWTLEGARRRMSRVAALFTGTTLVAGMGREAIMRRLCKPESMIPAGAVG